METFIGVFSRTAAHLTAVALGWWPALKLQPRIGLELETQVFSKLKTEIDESSEPNAIKSYPLGMGEFPTIQKFTDWDCYLYFSLPEFKIHSSSVYQICSSQLSSISSISRFLQVLSSVKSKKEAQVALPKCQVPQKPRVFYSMVPSRITILGYSISTMLRTALAPGPVGV